MGIASYAQNSFLGGEVSKSYQGRFDLPNYRTFMNVCLNGFPLETGAWVRRGGSKHLAPTRFGQPARLISFHFSQDFPYEIEFTDGILRFFAGDDLAMVNEELTLGTLSTANPAKAAVGTHGFSTSNFVIFDFAGDTLALKLHNRPCIITVTSSTEFTIADGITGANIDGATLTPLYTEGATVARIQQKVSPYVGGNWADVRAVACDIPVTNTTTTPGMIMLHPDVKPWVLQLYTEPTEDDFATFLFAEGVFKDGPYFDPVPGGTLATPSALVGNVTLTLSFPAYSASVSYSVGDYVVSSSVTYISLQDANINNTPASSATYWTAVNAANTIGPHGFQASDVGRHVRLFSEPAAWAAGSYTSGAIVTFGGTGVRLEGGTYWLAIANTTAVPGTDTTKWALYPTGARWTWGRINSLSNIIDRALAGSASIGDMTSGGNLAASFDGVLSQVGSACSIGRTTGGTVSAPATLTLTTYVGKNYSAASDQTISQAIVYPASDYGFTSFSYVGSHVTYDTFVVLNLRGKASAPGSSSDGTLLATTGSIANTTAPISMVSTDSATAWKYVWVEIITTLTVTGASAIISYTFDNHTAELSLFNAPGTGTSTGVIVQIVGDALLYTTAIRTWRLGLYSNTTGWPTCGTLHEGRLFLAANSRANRWDASKSNDIFNFAPTNADGSVSDNNAISYTFNSADSNHIYWMEPDQLGVVAGTDKGEWLIQASQLNNPLTPTSVQAHRSMKHKCANVEPRRTGLTLAVVQAYKRSLLEFFHDNYTGKFAAHNLALSGKHHTKTGLQEIVYQQELTPIIWGRRGDGALVGCTYKRETLISSQPPDFAGWHRHELGSERTVESICLGGSAGGTLDTLSMVTSDDEIRHVEKMRKYFEEDDDIEDTWQLDDALHPTAFDVAEGITVTNGVWLYGLWPLNGETVSVVINGLDIGSGFVVGEDDVTDNTGAVICTGPSNGALFIPFGDGIENLFTLSFFNDVTSLSQIIVGFSFTSDGQIVRQMAPAESGARTGPALGKARRNHQFAVLLANAVNASIDFGTDFSDTLQPINITSAGNVRSILSLYNGVYKDSVQSEYDFDSMICWRVERPAPVTIAAVGGFLETQDSA